MKIALVQINATMCAYEETIARMLSAASTFERQGADLVIFPATTLTGFNPQSLLNQEGVETDIALVLDELAERASVPILVPFLFESSGQPVPEVAYIHDKKIVPLRMGASVAYLKAHGHMPEDEPVMQFVQQDTDFGVALDLEGLAAYSAGSENADVIIYLPFSGFCADDEVTSMGATLGDGFYIGEATKANSWLVGVNSIGAQDEIVYSGGSFVISPWGEIAAALPNFEEAMELVEVEPLSEGPLEEPLAPAPYQRTRMIWGALTLALRDFVDKQGVRGVGLLLTGDLLTSVLAALAVDALGPMRVWGLLVPSADEDALKDARHLAHNLRIHAEEVNKSDFKQAAELIESNPLAVIRLLARAAAPQILGPGLLMLTAVDKTALALQQDPDCYHAASFAPFSDVYRTDILALASDRNGKSPVIPRSVLARLDVPRDLVADAHALSDARTLSELDSVLLSVIERGESVTDVVREGGNLEETLGILSAVGKGELSRRNCPAGPIVSERALVERRTPIAIHRAPSTAHVSAMPEVVAGLSTTMNNADIMSLMERLQTLAGAFEDVADPASLDLPHDLHSYLQDFASSGGFSTNGDDLWGSGLFSKN